MPDDIAMETKTRATIEDLYKVEGKAELVNGEIVHMPPAGEDPSLAGGEIFAHLRAYARHTRQGRAFPDGAGFRVNLPHRESFSPDAAYHVGPRTGMQFLEGAPIFAVEVRSANDYGPAAERAIVAKRADYFACGTQVVWDVDLLSEDVIKSYKASDPDHPVIFRRGDIADAEPAVPGWRMAVNDLFE
jgi:Uma2 family endonuclease